MAPLDSDEQAPDPVRVSALSDDDVCSLLPTCGPCSLACDPEKLAEEYVRPGTCALFSCTLTDGRTIEVEACNYDDPVAAAGFAHEGCSTLELRAAAR